jgi:hypothetical protein
MGRPREAVARKLVPKDALGFIRYFTANVKPQFPGDKCHERQQAYLRALDANPSVRRVVDALFRGQVVPFAIWLLPIDWRTPSLTTAGPIPESRETLNATSAAKAMAAASAHASQPFCPFEASAARTAVQAA